MNFAMITKSLQNALKATTAWAGSGGAAGSYNLDGAARVLLAELLALPLGLLITVLLTRHLGPAGYGLYTLAASTVGWIEWSIAPAFARAAIQLVGDAGDWRPVG